MDELLAGLKKDDYTAALRKFLIGYSSPSFGSLPKAEVDQLVLELLSDLGVVKDTPSAYELTSKLRITSARARNSIYLRELRKSTRENLQQKFIEVLRHPRVGKDGDFFVLDVESPVLRDFIKSRIRELNYVSDSTFSAENIRLPISAFVALIESALSDSEKVEAKKALVAAGAKDKSIAGFLTTGLRTIGERFAGEFGADAMEEVSDLITATLSRNASKLKDIDLSVVRDKN